MGWYHIFAKSVRYADMAILAFADTLGDDEHITPITDII